MIGKREWDEMARQIYALEKKMEAVYLALAEEVRDPELREIFRQLSSDETSHAAAINTIAEQILEQ